MSKIIDIPEYDPVKSTALANRGVPNATANPIDTAALVLVSSLNFCFNSLLHFIFETGVQDNIVYAANDVKMMDFKAMFILIVVVSIGAERYVYIRIDI